MGLVPVETSKAGKTSPSTELYGVRVSSDREQWQMGFGQISASVALKDGESVYSVKPRDEELPGIGNPLLILSDKKRVVGFSGIPARFDPEEKVAVWKAENIFSDNVISAAELERRKNAVREWADRFVYEVKIVYRLDSSGGSDYSSYYNSDFGPGSSGRELRTCGMAVAPDLMFVPTMLSREEAERIESIFITVDGREITGSFIGAFKDFTGFLLKPEEETFPRFSEIPATSRIEEVVPFFVVHVEQRFGGREVLILLNRGIGYEKTYRNQIRFKTVQPLLLGSYLLDLDGRLVGLVLKERREGGEDEVTYMRNRWMSAAMDFGFSMLNDEGLVFWPGEVRAAVLNRENVLDPNIIVKTKEESKRRPWLGVEFTSIDKDLAKMFKCEDVTRDGKRGLLVSYVYPGSPADQIGIKEGDILLSIQNLDEEYPIDLSSSGSYDYWRSYAFDDDENAHSEAPLSYSWRYTPWRDRGNYLTQILQEIGVGKPIDLVYWQNGGKKNATIEVQQAPRDFESAEKYKSEDVGLTVKDLTYEARRALQLEGDDQGVIVSKVEPGSPAAVAKIRAYDVVREIDQVPVANVKDFESQIAVAKQEGRNSVRLLLFDMGKLRFANLTVPNSQ